jgi:hypothetical protein
MFEVIEIGPLETGWFGRAKRAVKFRAVQTCFCEYLDRTFQGYQTYSTEAYRADFMEGTVVIARLREPILLSIGDRVSVDVLHGYGILRPYFRLARITG